MSLNGATSGYMEMWRGVVGFEGVFAVSSHGRVRRLVRDPRSGSLPRLRKLYVSKKKPGYPMVSLAHNGYTTMQLVHRLVMAAFKGPANGLHVNHKNGIRTDNRLENLEYVTPKENAVHARDVLHVHKAHGETHCCAKLTAADVQAIRLLMRYGAKRRKVAEAYGVHPQTVTRIVHFRRRKHG